MKARPNREQPDVSITEGDGPGARLALEEGSERSLFHQLQHGPPVFLGRGHVGDCLARYLHRCEGSGQFPHERRLDSLKAKVSKHAPGLTLLLPVGDTGDVCARPPNEATVLPRC